jgi:type II secretory ATPase GspE/PulE/Tfp pilus assembly ATPase PilB-like protein
MRDKLVESLRAALADKRGFVLFSAMPQGGLTTTTTVALRTMDLYMRDFVAVEDPADPEPAVENVEIVPCDIAGGESPAKLLPKLIRKDPNVIVMRDLVDADTVRMLSEEARDERLIVGTEDSPHGFVFR